MNGQPARGRFAHPAAPPWWTKISVSAAAAEFWHLPGRGEVIAEAEDSSSERREIVLFVEWLRPLHVVIVVTPRGKRRDW